MNNQKNKNLRIHNLDNYYNHIRINIKNYFKNINNKYIN